MLYFVCCHVMRDVVRRCCMLSIVSCVMYVVCCCLLSAVCVRCSLVLFGVGAVPCCWTSLLLYVGRYLLLFAVGVYGGRRFMLSYVVGAGCEC